MLTVLRQEFPSGATFGTLLLRKQIFCFSLELEWHENIAFHSCVPCGIYPLVRRDSWYGRKTYGYTYEIRDVPERSDILIHPANWPHELSGCVATGETIAKLRGERALLNSGGTFRALKKAMGDINETTIQIMEVRL